MAANAGVEGSVVVQEVKRGKGNERYNVATNEYEDLVKAGVVDPKKVTRAALENAASIAGLLLTTECLVTETPKEEKSGSAPGGQGGTDYSARKSIRRRHRYECPRRDWPCLHRTDAPSLLIPLCPR